jgi:hypothetical protein
LDAAKFVEFADPTQPETNATDVELAGGGPGGQSGSLGGEDSDAVKEMDGFPFLVEKSIQEANSFHGHPDRTFPGQETPILTSRRERDDAASSGNNRCKKKVIVSSSPCSAQRSFSSMFNSMEIRIDASSGPVATTASSGSGHEGVHSACLQSSDDVVTVQSGNDDSISYSGEEGGDGMVLEQSGDYMLDRFESISKLVQLISEERIALDRERFPLVSVSGYVMAYAVAQAIFTANMILADVEPDGHCQFSAIIRQVHHESKLTGMHDDLNVASLRHMAADWLRDQPELHGFIENPDGTGWEMYVQRVRTGIGGDGCSIHWGDHLTLVACANVLKVSIEVWNAVPYISDQGSYFFTSVSPLQGESLADLRVLLVVDKHYMSMEPSAGDDIRQKQMPSRVRLILCLFPVVLQETLDLRQVRLPSKAPRVFFSTLP